MSSRRPGVAADGIDGVMPRAVTEPETGEAFAEALAQASRERLQTVIRGGGTKLGWGRPPAAVDLVVGTTRLNRLLAHRAGDLTATVQAGMRLRDLNEALRGARQWLPVETAFEEATVGGVVATNEAGPSRHRSGTPRDLTIGVTLALTDGRLVKAGGTVVKNVAGYDLGKLVSGSHGTLAGIVDVTFKLVPIPQASSTLVAVYADAAALARDAGALSGSQVEPAAFDIRMDAAAGPTYSLLLRVATSPAATDAQIAAARALISGDTTVLTGDAERALWDDQIEAPWRDGAAVVRLSWLPTNLAEVLRLLEDLHRSGTPAALHARAMGTGLVRLAGDARQEAAAIARLRASLSVGHVAVLRAGADVKAAVDVWGPPRESDKVALAVKQMFDPAGMLNAGRGPI